MNTLTDMLVLPRRRRAAANSVPTTSSRLTHLLPRSVDGVGRAGASPSDHVPPAGTAVVAGTADFHSTTQLLDSSATARSQSRTRSGKAACRSGSGRLLQAATRDSSLRAAAW